MVNAKKVETKNPKVGLLKAIFAEASARGVAHILRDEIAPGVMRKRLSQASVQELAFLLDHLKGNSKSEIRNPRWKKYESSKAGLTEEIRDIARERFGADFAAPLNAFCARFGEPDGFRRMNVARMKTVKQRLLELQKTDPRKPGLKIVE